MDSSCDIKLEEINFERMDCSSNIKQEEAYSEAQEDGNHKLRPFVCGLCKCSYDQFVSFYKHFKNHSKDVEQDSFHICEDLPSSERDACEFQSESTEMSTFNCGICPASFITICMLHEHMEKHESKGSYTLDMQSKTGYPSPRQYPSVRLGNVNPSSMPDGISDAGVKSKRGRPSKQRSLGATAVLDSEVRNATKRNRPSSYVPPPEIGVRTRKGRSLRLKPSIGTIDASEVDVKTRRGRSSRRHGGVDNPDSTPEIEIKENKGRPQKHELSNDVLSAPDTKGKSIKSRPTSDRQSNKLGLSTKDQRNVLKKSGRVQSSKSMMLKKGRKVKRPDSVGTKMFDRSEKAGNGHKEKHVPTDSETDETLKKVSDENVCNERPDDVNSNISNAEKENNEDDSNMETDDAGVDTYNNYKDDENDDYNDDDAVNDDLFNDDSDEDWTANISGLIDTVTSCNKEKSVETRAEAEKMGNDSEDKFEVESADIKDTKEHVTYNFRRKQNSAQQTKCSARMKEVGKKKFLFCEECGMKKAKHMLVKHVEEKHKGVELSKEFLDVLGKLKGTQQGSKKEKNKTVKKEKLEDEDFVPKFSELIRPGKIKHIKVLRYGKVENYAECKRCGMITPLGNKLIKHRRAHKKDPDKFRPENLTRCKECTRVMFKVDSFKHKCYLKIISKEGKKSNEEGDRQDGKEDQEPGVVKRKSYKKYDKWIPCHLCGHLIDRYRLKAHIISHSDDRPCTCSHCSKTFKTEKALKLHERSNHGERTFQCDQCPRAFFTIHQLNYHLPKHSDERPFSCAKCGKLFSRRDLLSKHMRVHDAVKKYICKECGRAFNSYQNMHMHVSAVHRDERDWVCSWLGCGKMFNTGTALRRHMITHTGYKPEKCTLCDSAFSQRPELKTHLRKKHNTNEMPPPSHDNPYSGVKPQIIEQPAAAGDGGTDQPNATTHTYKTISFSSTLSMVQSSR